MMNNVGQVGIENCCGCTLCTHVCPVDTAAVSLVKNEKGIYPSVDNSLCCDCGKCASVCPALNSDVIKQSSGESQAFGCVNSDTAIRLQSSSGGFFTAIATSVLEKGGVVVGAAYNNDFKSVRYVAVDNIADLQALRGSKYVYATPDGIVSLIIDSLLAGRVVLFSGTPCHAHGIASLVEKKSLTDNFIAVDFVCHGVPSQLLFEKYIKEQESRIGEKTVSYNFRDKSHGWNVIDIHQDFSSNKKYHVWNWGDSYGYGFFSNITLQESCYHCKFCSFPRKADITMADFWGVAKKYPHLDDNKGTSLIVTHTSKGRAILHSMSEGLLVEEVDMQFAVINNSHALRPAAKPQSRDKFFENLSVMTFSQAMKTVTSKKLLIKRYLARAVKILINK